MIFAFLNFIFIMIYIEYKRTNIFFSYYTLFLLYWFLYTAGIYMSDEEIMTSTFSTLLIVLAGLFFIVGYNFIPLGGKNFKQIKKLRFKAVPNLSWPLIFLALIAVLLFVYVVILKIGINEYFFTSRANRSLIVRPYSSFMIFIDLFNIISGLAAFLYLTTKRRVYKNIFIIIFILAILHAVMTISRNNLVLLTVPIIYVYHYFDYIRTKVIILMVFFGLLIGIIWKSLLYILLIGSFHGGTTIELKVPREFIVWREIGDNIFSKDISLMGKSYMDAFINFLYPFNHTDNLSLWYVKNYEPKVAAIGGGRGFSNILEAYINFDILGVVAIFFILGLLIYVFQFKSQNSIFLFFPYMFSLAFVHRIFRSDFMSLTKTWWWMYFVSFSLLFSMFYLLRSRKNL